MSLETLSRQAQAAQPTLRAALALGAAAASPVPLTSDTHASLSLAKSSLPPKPASQVVVVLVSPPSHLGQGRGPTGAPDLDAPPERASQEGPLTMPLECQLHAVRGMK